MISLGHFELVLSFYREINDTIDYIDAIFIDLFDYEDQEYICLLDKKKIRREDSC